MERPYSALALLYDRLLGDRFFPLLGRNFDRLARRYPLRLDSAADVACGTGTFVKYLCRRGIPRVFGVDRSPAMLEVALRKNGGNQARFFCQDFLGLRLPGPVGLLTCNFDSLNYLVDPSQLFGAFQKFRDNLEPGGYTLFDMITRNQPWRGGRPRLEEYRVGNTCLSRSLQMDRRSGLQRSRVVIRAPRRALQEVHLQRAYPTGLVLRLLQRAGFRLLGVHDFMTLGPGTRRSQRIVIVARRP